MGIKEKSDSLTDIHRCMWGLDYITQFMTNSWLTWETELIYVTTNE